MPISATDTIALAFQHTKRQLIQPFRFWQWTRLALVGLLAGETGSGGGVNFPSTFNVPQQGGSSNPFPSGGWHNIDPALLTLLITILVIAGIVFFLLMLYVSSVMRFILFDSVLARECHIRQGWRRRQGPGWKLFLWQLGFMLVTFFAMAILIGIPVGFAFIMGWFKAPREHLVAFILGGILLFFVAVVLFVAVALIHVMTKDFVVPQMALEGIGAVEGWRRLWAMLQSEKGGYAVYIIMKVLLAIGAGIVIGLLTLFLVFLLVFPAAAVGIIAVISGKAAGFTWNVFTITLAVVVGCILLAVLVYLIALISVPAIVFFPAYAIYFFAARYRPLSLVLYPPPPPLEPTTGSPEPPLTPAPAT